MADSEHLATEPAGGLPVRQRGSDFGEAIRQQRTRIGMTVRDLAAASGVASSTVSKVENGLMSPTYDNILRLAAGLGVDVETLFNPRSEQMATGRRSVTRRGEGARLEARNYTYEMLCTDLSHKRFVPIVATLPGRSTSLASELVRHGGDEFVYVLEGEIVIHTDIYGPLRLGIGDSCYFDSRMGHSLIAAGEEAAVILWVASTPEAGTVIDQRHRRTAEEIVSAPAATHNQQ